MTDRLSLTNALADANIDRKAAERIATEIFDAIRENVATKADLSELRTELKADIAELGNRIALLRTELKGDIAALGNRIDLVERRIDLVEHRLLTRLGSLVVVLAGLLFAALHYWPPHGSSSEHREEPEAPPRSAAGAFENSGGTARPALPPAPRTAM